MLCNYDRIPINLPSPVEDPVFKRGWACPPPAGGDEGEEQGNSLNTDSSIIYRFCQIFSLVSQNTIC
jgi:hypothetical protein